MRIPKTDARKNFSEVISRAGHKGERVKVTHYGRTLAAIVPKSDLEKLEDCERAGWPKPARRPTAAVKRRRRTAGSGR
jgi:prevent-host-death family protein